MNTYEFSNTPFEATFNYIIMAGCSDLQKQCMDLLTKLKINQATLQQSLKSESVTNTFDNNLKAQLTDQKPEYARQKLKSIIKTSCLVDTGEQNHGVESLKKISENMSKPVDIKSVDQMRRFDWGERSGLEQEGRSRLVQGERGKWNKSDMSKLFQVQSEQAVDTLKDYESRAADVLKNGGTDGVRCRAVAVDNGTQAQSAVKPSTPNAVRRRRIIDQNVHVDSKLPDAEIRNLELGGRNLNFSYSQLMDDEDLQTGFPFKDGTDLNQNAVVDDRQVEDGTQSEGATDRLQYHMTLEDRGNNRQLNNFIRETTVKPKTALNSTHMSSSAQSFGKLGPGVSFQNTSGSNTSGASSLFRSQAKDRRLLGYDWIAALIHNDTGLMNESESYFHELREFRRSNRDECCNDFYMEGPFTLTETEPVTVEKALKESKVQPYTVNERLFTVPITEDLLGRPLDSDKENRPSEEPTQEVPRFVRVSIPRSTLQMPYKVRPHRRRSFDASDSCSLSDHCLMGWNAVSPATLPTAKSIALTDAVSGVNPKHAVTMAEAEKTAATFHWPLLTDPRPRPDAMLTLRRQYMDTTLNFTGSGDSITRSLSSSLGSASQEPNSLRQKTDDLLNSTYSMMYQLQKAREQREMERKRGAGKAAS